MRDLPNPLWDKEAERELWADICLNDFYQFCDYALGFNRPGWSWWTERVHRPFCEWFQSHVLEWESSRGEGRPEGKHLMVVVHREFGKTMIGTRAGQFWLHLRHPNLSSYTGSTTVTRAMSFLGPIREWMTGNDPESRFIWLYGNWFDKSRTWTLAEIVHAARTNLARTEPSLGTWGIETGLVGMHPDAGFMDDPIDYEKMGTDSQWLEKVNTHLASLSPVFRVDSFFVYTGTRYHDADAIGESLNLEHAKTITGMPMPGYRARDDGKWHVYFRSARDEEGKPTFPENWPEHRLRDYEKRHSLQYAAQLLNNPNTGAHVALNEEQVNRLYISRKDVPRDLRYSIHIDTAFKSRESVSRGDDSVIQLWGHARDGSGDVYYLEGYGSNRWRIEDFNHQLVILLQRLKKERRWPFVLTDEAEVGGKYGTWEMTIQSWCHGAGIPTPYIKLINRGGKRKIMRLTEAAGYWVDGHAKLVEGATGLDKLVDQMLKIGTSAHDDWADAGSDVFFKEVYTPRRRVGAIDAQPHIVRPWDRELQSGQMDREDWIRNVYDQHAEETSSYDDY